MTCAMFFKRSTTLMISVTAVVVIAMAISAKAQDARTAGNYTVHTLLLPDGGAGDVSMDYIAFDPATNSLWVPGGNTGAVHVVDVEYRPGPPNSKLANRAGAGTGRDAHPGTLGCGLALAMASCISGIAAGRRSVRLTRGHWRVSIARTSIRGRMVSPMSRPPRKCG